VTQNTPIGAAQQPAQPWRHTASGGEIKASRFLFIGDISGDMSPTFLFVGFLYNPDRRRRASQAGGLGL
jgi:hypothetical protein